MKCDTLFVISSFGTLCRTAFEVQNHVKYMKILHLRCDVGLVHFVLECQKSFLGEALLFQINLSRW